jgi:hypothetical protein
MNDVDDRLLSASLTVTDHQPSTSKIAPIPCTKAPWVIGRFQSCSRFHEILAYFVETGVRARLSGYFSSQRA